MSFPRQMMRPRPQFRTKFVGYSEDRIRLPWYLGISGRKQTPVYLMLPNDRSFMVTILIYGPSGCGKSTVSRIIQENAYMEYLRYPDRWKHPIFIFDGKTNYAGLQGCNSVNRDRYLLNSLHGSFYRHHKFLYIPEELIHVKVPKYCAPCDQEIVLKRMHEKWRAEGFWGVPWRHITDLSYLGTVLKVPEATLWAEELRPVFEKCTADPEMTLKGMIGEDGELRRAAGAIQNRASQAAAMQFVDRWRRNRFWFAEKDFLAMHVDDPFSVNVLTFVETPEKVYFNQLALLVALESLMSKMQASKFECQPIIIIHDILNFMGKDKPFQSQIVDALRRLIAGQSRTLAHGAIVVLETQSLDLPQELGDPRKYTIHIRMKWKSMSDDLRHVPGFVGGVADLHDHFNNFHSPSVIVRPALTRYEA